MTRVDFKPKLYRLPLPSITALLTIHFTTPPRNKGNQDQSMENAVSSTCIAVVRAKPKSVKTSVTYKIHNHSNVLIVSRLQAKPRC